jgi:hypothetical protein
MTVKTASVELDTCMPLLNAQKIGMCFGKFNNRTFRMHKLGKIKYRRYTAPLWDMIFILMHLPVCAFASIDLSSSRSQI